MSTSTNRLARESSPYLKQHQHNPVDWYPWGEEALARARLENKPILLSIGYSACHWCHVMERESFENAATAKIMNENFISIKVDREERPDLDQIYQNVAQAMTRSGGWPLTVFLTPELKPFFGGTYFPPEDRWGRPGFPRLLHALSEAYRGDRASVDENAEKLTAFIQTLDQGVNAAGHGELSQTFFDSAARTLLSEIDWQSGGFGSAPKFPNPMMLDFLWRYGLACTASDSPDCKEAVILALTKMASGGIYDQLGGGFHRYSVDDTWSVPHFEKMLYDNGLLLKTYSQVLLSAPAELFSDDDRKLFVRVVSETVEYLLREMRDPIGGFYSAQDADSEGEEGKFFAWDLDEISAVLPDQEAAAIIERYGVTKAGNFEHGKTVLYLAGAESPLLESARKKLFEARKKRIPPLTDDKILASWNGLAISGLAWASQALRVSGQIGRAEQAWLAARGAYDFVCKNLAQKNDRLFSAWQGGKAQRNAYLDDYAFLAMAALDLARFEQESTAQASELKQALAWIGTILRHFKDPSGAGYFFTSDDHEQLIQRPKTIYDQAIPSGIAVALTCMIALSEIDESCSASFSKEAAAQLKDLSGGIAARPFGHGELLNAAWLAARGPVVLAGGLPESPLSDLVSHPHIYLKPGDNASVLICHRGVCDRPYDSFESAKSALLAKF